MRVAFHPGRAPCPSQTATATVPRNLTALTTPCATLLMTSLAPVSEKDAATLQERAALCHQKVL